MSKLLLLEDDLSLIDGLTYSLNKAGYEVDGAHGGGGVRTLIQTRLLCTAPFGCDAAGQHRLFPSVSRSEKGSTVPIIFLTASDEEVNVIRGLDSGGDDYITKPFKLGNCSPHPGAAAPGGISADRPIKCSVEI